MTDPADAPAKPAHNLRGAILWTAGILVALGLAWFVAAVVVPVVQVRRMFDRNESPGIIPQRDTEQIASLGGPGPAYAKLSLYLRLPDSVANRKWVAWRLLGYCGRLAVPELVSLLRSEHPGARRSAAYALGQIGPDAAEAVPALVESLEDPDTDLRLLSFNALGAIGPAARDALPAMEKFRKSAPDFGGDVAIILLDTHALDKVRGTQ